MKISGLAVIMAFVPLAVLRAQQIDAPAENRYADWRNSPFTCRDLVAADAGKDASTDDNANYDAIIDWEKSFPKLAERRDLVNVAALQETVLKWCSDRNMMTDPKTPLADVVEKAWRMMGY